MNETRNESIRRFIEMAVSSGRRLQSSQTGYLHHFYGDEEGPSLTIPLVENALFVLALLRKRTAENGMEAKDLLERLLHFQHPGGNFPIYLHEFPECKDRFVAAHVSVPLFWILKHFHQVLGNDLKKRVENALIRALQHSLLTIKEKPVPYHLSLKIAALAAAVGSLLQQREIGIEGQQLLDELHAAHPTAWYSPIHLGSILSSLQMVYQRIDISPWHLFWKHIENTWHREGCAYIGPSLKEYQVEFEPQVTLYDLYLSYFSGQFSVRCMNEQHVHLEGALIHPSEDILSPSSHPLAVEGIVQESKWQLSHKEKFSYSYIEKGNCHHTSNEKGFHSFRLMRGSPQRVHTLVCQGGNYKKMELVDFQDKLDFIFYLDEPILVEDREKNREVAFYFELDHETEINIDGQQATTFALGEPIEIRNRELSLTMIFTLEQGEGRFLGHLMRGNRSSQLNLKGKQRFNAYDWQLFLRTVKRHEPCKIKVQLLWSH